jgi:hypothetical protein
MRSMEPGDRGGGWVGRLPIRGLTLLLVALALSACADSTPTPSPPALSGGTWRGSGGGSLVLRPEIQLATLMYASEGAAPQGQLRDSPGGGASVTWLAYPHPETVALGSTSTLSVSGRMLTLSPADTTKRVYVFMPSSVYSPGPTPQKILDLRREVRGVTSVSSEALIGHLEVLRRFKRLTVGMPEGAAAAILRGSPISQDCLVLTVDASANQAQVASAVRALPSVAALRYGPEDWNRCVVMCSPPAGSVRRYRR